MNTFLFSSLTPRRLAPILCLSFFWPHFAPRANAQPDALLTVKPLQTQTIAGVTMRLMRLRWVWPREVWGAAENDNPAQRMLGYWFDVVENGKPSSSYAIRLRQLGPVGEALGQNSSFYQATVGWGTFNPRWPKAALEFDLLDYGATPEAIGEFSSSLEFKAIPVPHLGQSLLELPEVRLQRTLTTEQGTKISIEQVSIRHYGADNSARMPDSLEFLVRWVVPAQYPDTQIQVGLQAGSVRDDTGQDLTQLANFEGTKWFGYDDTGGDIANEVNWGQAVLSVRTLPAPQAQNVNVKLWVRETIPALKQRNKVRQFHFDFDPRRVPFEKTLNRAPVAIGANAACQVTLENTTLYSQRQCWFTVITKDTRPTSGPAWHWVVQDWQLTRQHQPLNSKVRELDPIIGPYFYSDGTPLQDNEWSQNLYSGLLPDAIASAPVTQPTATQNLHKIATPGLKSGSNTAGTEQPTCELELQLRPEQVVSRVADFPALPLPACGQELNLNQSIDLADGSRLVARSVHYVTEPGQVDDGRFIISYNRPTSQRLELRIELEPNAGANEKFYYRRDSTATDNLGYALLPEHGLEDSGGDHFYLIKLFAPLPGATSFKLHLRFDETRLGASQKLILHGVPMPKEEQQGR